jgi:hypothetical protein
MYQKPDKGLGPVAFVISREEVEAQNMSSVLPALKSLVQSPDRALEYFENVDIAFHGYNDDARELFEIPEVREYVHKLDGEFPFWLFFLTKYGLGLQCLMLCFMPPYLTEEARRHIFPERLGELLLKRWFPAMNYMCEAVGFSEEEIESLSSAVVKYFTHGPQRITGACQAF